MKNHHVTEHDWLKVQLEIDAEGIVMFSASDAKFGVKRFVFHPLTTLYSVTVRRGAKAVNETVYDGPDHRVAIDSYNELELV